MPEEKAGVVEKLKDVLIRRHEVLFAYLHGSFLRQRFRDIDIAVYVRKIKKRAVDFEIELEIELEKRVGYPVDVRVLNQAPLSFRFKVIKDGKLLCSRNENKRSDFEGITFAEYHDFSPYRRRYLKEVLGLEV